MRMVSRVWKRFQETGDTTRTMRSAQPRKTTARDDWVLECPHRNLNFYKDNQVTPPQIGHFQPHHQKQTTDLQGKQSVWCQRVKDWTPEGHWAGSCFSDESRFNIGFNNGRVRVWCQNTGNESSKPPLTGVASHTRWGTCAGRGQYEVQHTSGPKFVPTHRKHLG